MQEKRYAPVTKEDVDNLVVAVPTEMELQIASDKALKIATRG